MGSCDGNCVVDHALCHAQHALLVLLVVYVKAHEIRWSSVMWGNVVGSCQTNIGYSIISSGLGL